MKKIIAVILLVALVLLSGCESINWGAVGSIGADLVQMRADREEAGQPHIEDVFKAETER